MTTFKWKKQVGFKYSSICSVYGQNNNEIPFFESYINHNKNMVAFPSFSFKTTSPSSLMARAGHRGPYFSNLSYFSKPAGFTQWPLLCEGMVEKKKEGSNGVAIKPNSKNLSEAIERVIYQRKRRGASLLKRSSFGKGGTEPVKNNVFINKEKREKVQGKTSKDFASNSLPKSILQGSKKIAGNQKEEYFLETFKRSNQDTCLIHKPAVIEGNWVQSGDLLTDCASSVAGELSLGQNLLIAYMPWEGYNFEDAILISERLVMDDLYTSVHIERYELETQQTKLGSEEITRHIPDVSEKELAHLDSFGIIKLGSWVEEGDILVGKITPINKKKISPYQKLLYTILEKQVRPIKDSSLRAPKGIKAKVIDIKYFLKSLNYSGIPFNSVKSQPLLSTNKASSSLIKKGKTSKAGAPKIHPSINKPATVLHKFYKKRAMTYRMETKRWGSVSRKGSHRAPLQSLTVQKINNMLLRFPTFGFEGKKDEKNRLVNKSKNSFKVQFKLFRSSLNFSVPSLQEYTRKIKESLSSEFCTKLLNAYNYQMVSNTQSPAQSAPTRWTGGSTRWPQLHSHFSPSLSLCNKAGHFADRFIAKRKEGRSDEGMPLDKNEKKKKRKLIEVKKATLLKNMETIHIYLAEKRKIQVGDKMAGRHGNKGIVSKILPIQDMPYLPDGTPIDMVLNPLGVPSRMNVGQIYECLLGLAGKFLGENYKVPAFDEIYGPEASRSFVFNKLNEARSKTGFKWLFDPNSPGKIRLSDGRNGECFDQKVTVGQAYMLRLVHMVDDKIHC